MIIDSNQIKKLSFEQMSNVLKTIFIRHPPPSLLLTAPAGKLLESKHFIQAGIVFN